VLSIIGINAAGQESGNADIPDVADLPWLQDDADQDAWGTWAAEWRDVVVLDADNVEVGRLNLTDHDLSEDVNRQLLVDLFTAAGAP